MGLGSGIQGAGEMFMQAILGKHQEQERLKREALAQQNELADQAFRQRQLDNQIANQEYDRTWRSLAYAPEGTTIDAETRNKLSPLDQSIYTSPQRDIGHDYASGEETGRFNLISPYRKEERVAEINAGKARDVAQISADARTKVAEAQNALRQISLDIQRGRLNLADRALQEQIRYHMDYLDSAEARAILGAQTTIDMGNARIGARTPNAPRATRPTGLPTPGATAPAGGIDWSKLGAPPL